MKGRFWNLTEGHYCMYRDRDNPTTWGTPITYKGNNEPDFLGYRFSHGFEEPDFTDGDPANVILFEIDIT